MNRRGFLGVLGAGFTSPAIVRAESLMKIIVPKKELIIASTYSKMTVDRYGNLTFTKMPEPSEDGIILCVNSYNELVERDLINRIKAGVLTRFDGDIFFPNFQKG